ncbi:DEAD/DEAH box helicase [bacterium]|nr:DEAD/DEAH box helicase [bacterium]
MFKQIRLLPDQYLGVSFTYHADIVARLKRLEQRRWNPDARRWEVHLSHLPQLLEILSMDERNLPRDVRLAYEAGGWKHLSVRFSLGNDYSRIGGRGLPLEALDLATSFPVPGAEFHPSYKNGEWDGRRHLLRRGPEISFPSGLLSCVRRVLREEGVDYEEEDGRQPPPRTLELAIGGPALRNYQEEAVAAACRGGRGILQMATGAGKTLVAAHIIARLGCPAVFFVHTRDLMQQARDMFEKAFGCAVGRIGDGRVEPAAVTVAMLQTTARAMGFTVPEEEVEEGLDEGAAVPAGKYAAVVEAVTAAPLAIFDECHHLPAETFFRVAMALPSAYYRFGLSATPYRADAMDLLVTAALGDKLYEVNSSALIDRGFLVPPRIRFLAVPATGELWGAQTYAEIYTRHVVENGPRNAMIAEQARRCAERGLTVLVLVQQIRHGEALARLLPDAVLLTGRVDSELRRDVLDRLRARQVEVVIATTLADEGLDIPSLDVLILAGAGKSETRALQRVGRALRQVGEKREALVLDFADPAKYLCEHSRRRLQIYRTEPRFALEFDETFARIPDELRDQVKPGLFDAR